MFHLQSFGTVLKIIYTNCSPNILFSSYNLDILGIFMYYWVVYLYICMFELQVHMQTLIDYLICSLYTLIIGKDFYPSKICDVYGAAARTLWVIFVFANHQLISFFIYSIRIIVIFNVPNTGDIKINKTFLLTHLPSSWKSTEWLK